MRVSSFQPTFMPYAGYFALIDHVDKLVVLDDVAFNNRSWQQRVFIRGSKNPNYLTIPIKIKGNHGSKIKDVIINSDSNYIHKHLETIRHTYSKYPFFKKYFFKIEDIYKKNFMKLIDLNLSFIFFF